MKRFVAFLCLVAWICTCSIEQAGTVDDVGTCAVAGNLITQDSLPVDYTVTVALFKNSTTGSQASLTGLSRIALTSDSLARTLETDSGYFLFDSLTAGGFIISGSTVSELDEGNTDIIIIKTDSNGESLWTKSYDFSVSDRGDDIHQTTDGGYIITGTTSGASGNEQNIFLLKIDGGGDSVWFNNAYGTGERIEARMALFLTGEGGYILAGKARSATGWGYVVLTETDGNGGEKSSTTCGVPDVFNGSGLDRTSDNGMIITGFTIDTTVDYPQDIVMKKYDRQGTESWVKRLVLGTGANRYDSSMTVRQTGDGGYLIAGLIHETTDLILPSMYLVKTDFNGDTVWTRLYDTRQLNGEVMLELTDDGGCILAGMIESAGMIPMGNSITLQKVSAAGSIEWISSYGGNDWRSSACKALHQTDDGGFIAVGTTNLLENFLFDYRIFLVKTEGEGSSGGY